MALSLDDVRAIAHLAGLDLPPAELETQARHLNTLLDQFEALKALDLGALEPLSHPLSLKNVLRDDVVRDSLPRDVILAAAPETRDGCFVVPRILADDAPHA